MNESTRTSTSSDCSPSVKPADQPHPPNKAACPEPTTTQAPEPKSPTECPPSDCDCPAKPKSTSDCLEDLIDGQAQAIAAADKAKTFKADLEALLGKAKVAGQEYNRDKYQKLVKQWIEQDEDIAELIRKLVCAVPCWKCIIECYICEPLKEISRAEWDLYDEEKLYTEVNNLHDLQYWHMRNKDIKERTFNRIKSVLAVWEKPAQTIEKTLADDAKLIADANKALGTDAPKVVYDVFLKLVSMHLAIAPPAGSKVDNKSTTTRIDKAYTQFCGCDKGTPADCCGTDVGPWSLRQRLIGPQPFLVDPNAYMDVICCLVEKYYWPAKEALSEAEGGVISLENKIKAAKAKIEDGLKNFEKNAKNGIPSDVECCDKQIKIEKPEAPEAS